MDSYALSKFNDYNRSGRLTDLNEAIQSMAEVARSTPESHENYAGLLYNSSILLGVRFERLGRLEDLEQAIQRTERAIAATPQSHPNFILYLTNLGNKLQRRFERTGKIEDLDAAIRITREALDSIPEGYPDTSGLFRDLSVKLIRKYERYRRKEDLDEAIDLAERAARSMSTGDAECARMFHNLANMYEDRHSLTGRIEHLQEAIAAATEAVDKTPASNPHHADMSSSLGMKLMKRFEVTGNVKDSEKAIYIAQLAVDTTPDDHPYDPGCLTTLGHMLWRRYERTGRTEDIENAVQKIEQAVHATPSGSPDLAVRSNSLGALLYTRYERTGRIEDLYKAIYSTESALASTPEGHPRLIMYSNNLSVLLVNRFERNGRLEDLDNAIKLASWSVKATQDDHPSQAAHWNNLGTVLKRRFERTGHSEDLEHAISNATLSVAATPEDHIDLSGRLNNLGHSLSLSSQDQQREALECFKRSWGSANGIPFHRVDAARQAVTLLKRQSKWTEAASIAKEAVDLLPAMNNRSLDRQDQLHIASKFSGLVSDACSLALQTGDLAGEALKLLERGRGVILGLLIEDRSDISPLRMSHPEQAAQYDRLRIELNQSTQLTGAFSSSVVRSNDRLSIAAELNACISSIRQLPGFERFLLGPTSEELMALAVQGPIAVVNVNSIRSDAFVVSRTAIQCIPLPGMMATKVDEWANLSSNTSRDYISRNKEYRTFLKELWVECVKPILREADSMRGSGESLSRIWWIGVGNASSLPFHAAGEHLKGSMENTASQVTSSYIPTLKALSYARERCSEIRAKRAMSKLVIVAMPETPGHAALHYTTDEMSEIEAATRGAFSCTSLVQPNAKSVLAHLEQCSIAHFACHGVSNHVDPLSSYLVLHDNVSSMPRIDKITVRQISEASLSNARLAYLSACSTAENKAERLADEVIHLASGFQVAGFGHVIASMWAADDEVCVQVARNFYQQIATEMQEEHSNENIAAALHAAVEKIRARYLKAPLQWAPFVHIGA